MCPISDLMLEKDGFDHEQIWSMLQLRNEPTKAFLEAAIKELSLVPEHVESSADELASASELSLSDPEKEVFESDSAVSEDLDEDIPDVFSEMEEEFIEEDDESPALNTPKRHFRKMPGDDEFFSLAEMDNFGDEGVNDEDEIDYSLDPDQMSEEDDEEQGDDEEGDLMYADFFEAPKGTVDKKAAKQYPAFLKPSGKKRPADDIDSESSEEEMEDDTTDLPGKITNLFGNNAEADKTDSGAQLSTFEKQQQKLAASIEKLEDENIKDKGWQMKGEANNKIRPKNSLLEEDMEFDYAAKPVPIVSEETTQTLEGIITSRIIEESWDDVERKLAPAELAARMNGKKPRSHISDEKSKKSLADEYEDDFKKQTQSDISADPTDTRSDALKKEHAEIEGLFRDVCTKLDALSNWHFTPKAPKPEMSIVSVKDTAAIEMEEIIPVHVSDGQLLAPEELFVAPKRTRRKNGRNTNKE